MVDWVLGQTIVLHCPSPIQNFIVGVLRVLLIPHQEEEEEGSVLDCGDFEYGINLI